MQFYKAYEIKVKEYQNFKTKKQPCCAAFGSESCKSLKRGLLPSQKAPKKICPYSKFLERSL